jgi:flagellar biosynthesis/type III secretory pathway protein FliH
VRRRSSVEGYPVAREAAHEPSGELFVDDDPEPGVLGEPSERRKPDTMIDDIVPRAEEEAICAIRAAVEAAAADRTRQLLDSESQLVELALIIARRVIAREVSLDPGIVRGLVREGLNALGERDRVVVRVGTFFADVREDIERDLRGVGMGCEVVVDPALGQCGCSVETELGRVDESIEDRLATLLDGLPLGPNPTKGKE